MKAFIEKQPNDSFLQHALALELVKLGDDASARNVFEKLLQQNPNYAGSYYHLGKLLERAGETANAIAIYEKGIEVARALGDNHAGNELQGALDDIS